MKKRYVTGAIAGTIGVIGAFMMVEIQEERRIQTERNRAESRGEAPIEPPHERGSTPTDTTRNGAAGAKAHGAPDGSGGDTKDATGRATSGATDDDEGHARGGSPGDAERAARAGAVARAADDATRASRETERGRDISPDDVVEAMAAVKPLMKKCYDQMLDDFPDADGRLVATFTVRAEDEMGEVDVVKFKERDSQFDAQMKGCMTRALDAFTIPMVGTNPGELTVSYPFTFTKEE